ncbi:uncharacterized protein LOC129567031 [Sitodiplosis mosellana]|uniref:uncharacterized protein LOC129567031 n=1 Tax=Sitodiplosis mosellana TaxID=263140 RepID=UPI002443831F|nr:uncharacterized protein LOC129567031 [Sitodiplosis mosellana]
MEEKAGKKTKFELDVNPIEMDAHLRIRQMSLDLSSPNHIPLNVRIAEFQEDPQNMDEMTAFIDDILKKAQIEADARLEQKNKTEMKKNGKALSLINGFKRGRMVTRAQTVIVRMFEAICNCTTQTAATLPGRVSTRSQSVSK